MMGRIAAQSMQNGIPETQAPPQIPGNYFDSQNASREELVGRDATFRGAYLID
jgi:hypothetical protein